MISAAADLARRLARDAEAVCRHYLSKGTPCGPLLGYRRCPEHAGSQPLCAACRSRLRPWCGRQMDRRRDRRAWRSPGSDPPQPQPAIGLGEADRRSAPLSRPAASAIPSPTHPVICHRAASGSSEAARRLFAAGRPVPGTPAEAYLRARGITGTARLARLALPPVGLLPRQQGCSARSWPALLAAVTDIDGKITGDSAHLARPHGGRPRRRCPIRAAPSDICSATACALARRPTFSPPAKASRRCWRSNRSCPICPMIAGLSANHLAALDLPSSLRRLYVARDNDAAGRRAANRLRERHQRHRHSPARAGACRLQSRSLPSRRRHYARTARPISSSRTTARAFSPVRARSRSNACRCCSRESPEGRKGFRQLPLAAPCPR